MGYDYEVKEISFKIPTEHIQQAIALLRKKAQEWLLTQQEKYPQEREANKRLKSIIEEEDDAVFLQRLTEDINWNVTISQEGIVNPSMTRKKVSYVDTEWMDAMHPFILSGSFIQILDEDGNLYREVWKDGKKARRVFPTWPDPEEEEEENIDI